MSTNKGYNPRGFRRKDYMANLSNNYNAIIEYAKDTTNGLDIQYRDNYINIYYLGGSLLKLSGRGSVAFDKNYYYLPESLDSLRATHIAALVHKNFRAKVSESKTLSRLSEEELMTCKNIADDINRSLVSSRDNVIKRLKSANKKEVCSILEEMKDQMKRWKDKLRAIGIRKSIADERTVQHYISLFNKETAADSDFIVIDLEYALSDHSGYCIPPHQKDPNKKQPRIDIVAIEKRTGQLYVLELKYGLKSTKGDAGVVEHYNDYLKSVGADDKWLAFWNDIDYLVEAQKKDNVLSHDVSLIKSKPIFGFVYKPEFSENECNDFNQLLKEKDLSSIMTIYLTHSDYAKENPSTKAHVLKKP